MWFTNNWKDYELLDTSDGERLERWGKYILIRPDPQVIWSGVKKHPAWKKADGIYSRSNKGGGSWIKQNTPESWNIKYQDLSFVIKPMGFKHTGLFPEQATNWDWFSELIRTAGRPIKVLNLFAYTGGATMAAAAAGASVCHVDAAKGMVATAKENAAAGMFDPSYLLNDTLRSTVKCAADAYAIIERESKPLASDTLLHGDYCLPNVMLKDWRVSALIDLDHAGMGDRHVDLYWGAWTLNYNLGHDNLRSRFFDAYGRDRVDEEKIALISVIETLG